MPDSDLLLQFLKYSAEKLRELAGRIDVCLSHLNDDQIWSRGSSNENAAGNLVLHLCGNVRQWIIAGVGNQPDVRRRREEFAAQGGVSVEDLRERLRTTIDEAVAVLEGVTLERLSDRLEIQSYKVSAMEAIYHVVEHFSMHTGQILLLTKMFTGGDLGFYRHLD